MELSLCFQEQCPLGMLRMDFQQRPIGLTGAPLALKHDIFTGTMKERESLPIPFGIGNLKQEEAKGATIESVLFLKEVLPVGDRRKESVVLRELGNFWPPIPWSYPREVWPPVSYRSPQAPSVWGPVGL